jgi:hypothetical protein
VIKVIYSTKHNFSFQTTYGCHIFKDLKNIESSGGKLPFESLQSDKEKKEETKDDGDEDEIDEQQKEGRNKESSSKSSMLFITCTFTFSSASV